MGCWGMGIAQTDEFCEVYEQFMDAYDEGEAAEKITADILEEYHEEFPDEDGVMHDVYFALAKAEWMCCAQSPLILQRVKEIIDSEANILFYREMGAREPDLKTRRKNLDKFWIMLQTPRSRPRKRTPKPGYESAESRKGMVFWYRSKGAVYGAVVLDVVSENGILVALSDALECEPKSVETVLNADVYTAAWFFGLLSPKRVHEIGMVSVSADYNGRGGMYHTDQFQYCDNFGMDQQWNHEKSVLSFPGMKILDLLEADNVPESFRNPDRLNQLLRSKRGGVWYMG